MKAKEIVNLALTFLKREDLLAYSPFTEDTNIPENSLADINLLLKCFNLIYGDICTDYFPILFEQEIAFSNNTFSYSLLTKSMIEIKKLTDEFGKNVKYRLQEDGIHAKVQKANIIYSYKPSDYAWEDSIFMFGGKVPERVIAYGVAMEFSFINGLYGDATIWETRYKNALQALMSKKSEMRIAGRRWA